MRRRTLLGGIAATPLAALAQEPAKAPAPPATNETPTIPTVEADSVVPGAIKLFDPKQLSALEHLSRIIGTNIAQDAGTAAFLDFLISRSPSSRAGLYKDGLNRLNSDAMRLYQKPFGEISAAQAEPLLQTLKQPWTYNEPADAQARFLRTAKDDILTATMNSREYIAIASKRKRTASGIGQYCFPID